jgi:hypothetical protein
MINTQKQPAQAGQVERRVRLSTLIEHKIRKICGLAAWDAETNEILATGCERAEAEAILRYGENWRTETAEYRISERKRIWGPWHFILKPNV